MTFTMTLPEFLSQPCFWGGLIAGGVLAIAGLFILASLCSPSSYDEYED